MQEIASIGNPGRASVTDQSAKGSLIRTPKMEWRSLAMWSSLIGSTLIGSAFVLTIAGNRWASYIKSPIPGIYLADLLLLLGVIATVPMWREVRRLSRWVWWTYGAVAAYVLVVLAPEFLIIPEDDRYLALRDAAPFLYFALVPLIALSVRGVDAKTAIYVVRAASLLLAVGTALVHIGVLPRFTSPLLGSDFTSVFDYRSDLTGAGLAIGMVAWGAWPAQAVRAGLGVQLAYVAVAAFAIGSRSGVVAVLVAILVIAYRQRHVVRGLMAAAASVLTLVLGMLYGGPLTASLVVPTLTAPAASPTEVAERAGAPSPPENAEPAPPARRTVFDAWTERIVRSGTVSARVDTWANVVTGLAGNGTWLLGGAAGSDYLYELCTGVSVAPQVISLESGDPKCAVDDRGPEPVVRDPHNWVLNIAVTHGILGVAVFGLAIGVTLWRGRRSEIYPLAAWTIGFFLVTGLTFLISAGYALLPISVGAAWIVSRAGFGVRRDAAEYDTLTAGMSTGEPTS